MNQELAALAGEVEVEIPVGFGHIFHFFASSSLRYLKYLQSLAFVCPLKSATDAWRYRGGGGHPPEGISLVAGAS